MSPCHLQDILVLATSAEESAIWDYRTYPSALSRIVPQQQPVQQKQPYQTAGTDAAGAEPPARAKGTGICRGPQRGDAALPGWYGRMPLYQRKGQMMQKIRYEDAMYVPGTDAAYTPRISRDKLLRHLTVTLLTARQKQMLDLYYLEGKTIPRIAGELGVNKSTVSRTISRALKKLRQCLDYEYH